MNLTAAHPNLRNYARCEWKCIATDSGEIPRPKMILAVLKNNFKHPKFWIYKTTEITFNERNVDNRSGFSIL